MRSTKQQARVAGFLYLVLALIAPVGLLVVPGQLIVHGDAAATAERIRSSAWLLRLGIGSELAHQVLAIFLVLALYRLFRSVDEDYSRQLVILGALVSVPIMFVNVLNDVAALILLGGADFLSAFTQPQLEALAYFFLRLHGRGIDIASVFWGLWLFPFGILVVRSRFIPRFFGYLLWLAGAAYLVTAFATLVAPQLSPLMSPIALPLETAEVPIILWLAIWGARDVPAEAPA